MFGYSLGTDTPLEGQLAVTPGAAGLLSLRPGGEGPVHHSQRRVGEASHFWKKIAAAAANAVITAARMLISVACRLSQPSCNPHAYVEGIDRGGESAVIS